MFCKNCGKELPEGQELCPDCMVQEPAELMEQEIMEQSPETEEVIDPYREEFAQPLFEESPVEAPKKKSAIFPVIAGVLLLAVVAFCALRFEALKGQWIKHFGTGREYFVYVAQKDAQTQLDQLTHVLYSMSDRTDFTDLNKQAKLELELSEQATALLQEALPEAVEGLDLNNYRNISLTADLQSEEGSYRIGLDLGLNASSLLEIVGLLDMEGNDVYLGVPGLTDKYLILSDVLESFTEQINLNTAKFTYPSEEVINQLAHKYYDLLIQAVGQMEKGKEILTVGQEQQKVTTLHYSITEKELSRIAEVILPELKDDAQIKEILADFQAYAENLVGVDVLDGENFVEEYEIAIRDCLDDLAEETPSEEVLYDVVFFVDSKDRICGMELSEEGKILSRSEILYKDSKFVGEVETDLDGDTMRISLNGEYTKTYSKCSYTVAVNEVTYAQVIMDMVMETEDTRCVLSLDVIPTDELLSVMFEDSGATGTMVAMLEPSIRFTAYWEGEEKISIIELLSNEEKFASVTFSTGPSGGEGVTLPTSDQAMEMDQIVDWCNSISVDKVEELINTLKLPAELDESISPFVDYARSVGGFGNLISMFMG